ncbi:MAG: 1-acyl-sn-glycerol-3-phosphate acyltransferase [Pirellulales bacterium]|nr:1-acyl-sn-glycerol-3-phosphate acyltransferase [Pirellulales bacterium]
MSQRSIQSRLWYDFLRYLLRLTAVLAFRIRITGWEDIPASGGVLLVSNHQSHLDPPMVGIGCRRRLNFLARQSLFHFAPFRWLIKSLDAIPLDREGIGISGMKESLRRLKRGEMLMIFPEGTRCRDGRIATFMPGFTALARRSGAAILPAAIDGAFAAWPRSRTFPRLGRLRVHYGETISPEEIAAMDEQELLTEVERRVRECFARCQFNAP